MGRYDNWNIEDADREQRRAARKKKWEAREKKFWRAFLFTEDGKPKSGLVIYTFCLSIGLVLLCLLAFNCSIEWLTPALASLPVFWNNLIQSLAAGAAMLLVSVVLHLIFKDKRLMFGSYLWLAFYAVVMLIAMLVILRGTGAWREFLAFFGWFVAIPVALGLLVTGLLYRRDYTPPATAEEAEPWKKFTQRR